LALFSRTPVAQERAKEVGDPRERLVRLAYAADAFDGGPPPASLRALFPQVSFEPNVDESFAGALERVDVVIATADGAKPNDVEKLLSNLRCCDRRERVIIFLTHAEVETTRRIVREGAGDVLLAPISEPALAATLERILSGVGQVGSRGGRSGHVVSILKAGGGVGATSVAAQVAAMVAEGGHDHRVCLVDLDVQLGMVALDLDVTDSITIGEVVAAAGSPTEIRFAERLTPHSSGVRVLAAPQAFMPLDAIGGELIDGLVLALKRDFDLVLLDLPGAWTNWTSRALRQSDQIVMVTNISVPHAHMTHRQLRLLSAQGLDNVPLTLVCNRCGGDAPTAISTRSMEGAVGRTFDVTIPEDRKLMNSAVNEGAAITQLRRGTKLEKALRQLVSAISAARVARANSRRG